MLVAKTGKKREPTTYYVCDRKRCENCAPHCHHTKDINHALYRDHFEFEYYGIREEERAMYEVIRQ